MLKRGLDLNKLSRILSNMGREMKVFLHRGRRAINKNKLAMPFSFQGFGAMAIIAMVLILSAAQGIEYLKTRRRHH
jgi:hypothetical protein